MFLHKVIIFDCGVYGRPPSHSQTINQKLEERRKQVEKEGASKQTQVLLPTLMFYVVNTNLEPRLCSYTSVTIPHSFDLLILVRLKLLIIAFL